MHYKKLVIGGVGLIGGSFALALRKAGAVDEIVGLGRSRGALEVALHAGVIDRIAADWADAAADADLIVLAMPVGAIPDALAALAPHLAAQTALCDVGSTKQDVVAAARAALGARFSQFVPAHPIAGAEKSGVGAAQADLFCNHQVVLTPEPETAPAALAFVRAAWLACGAKVHEMTAAEHDGVFAAVSHLPHVLAYALVDSLARRDNADTLFAFAAGGFRDFTRIAASHPEMWRDICIANRAALGRELDAYLAALMQLRALIARADGPGLQALFAHAREKRMAWQEGKMQGD